MPIICCVIPDPASWPFLAVLRSCWHRLSLTGSLLSLASAGPGGRREVRRTRKDQVPVISLIPLRRHFPVAPAPGSEICSRQCHGLPSPSSPGVAEASFCCLFLEPLTIPCLESQQFPHLCNRSPVLKSLCLKGLEPFLLYCWSICNWHLLRLLILCPARAEAHLIAHRCPCRFWGGASRSIPRQNRLPPVMGFNRPCS